MLSLFASVFSLFLSLFKHDVSLLVENMLLKKEVQLLKRKLSAKRISPSRSDRFWFAFLMFLNPSVVIRNINIFSPKTVLFWQKRLIASFWTFLSSDTHPGRPPVPAAVKELILSIKNKNPSWGCKRIRDELLIHCGIDLHKKTIHNILKDFRRQGKIRKSVTWKQFLSSHIDSIFAADFFTVDTLFNERFYVFFFIAHNTREIVYFSITRFPTKEFVRQHLIEFQSIVNRPVYLIHDHGPQLLLDYSLYNIKDICTSIEAPNMNAIAERFVKSVRNEALDNFLLFNEKQIRNILIKYINYYNSLRPHQGINAVPTGTHPPLPIPLSSFSPSLVRSKPIFPGLITHFFTEAA
jgi:hypothetical protein